MKTAARHFQCNRAANSEARDPKPERRPKPETRNHRPPDCYESGLTRRALSCQPQRPSEPHSRSAAWPLRLSDFGLLSAFGLRPSDFAAKARPCHVTPRPPNASNSLATSPLWRCQTETEPQQRCRSADTGAPEQHPWNGENSRGPIEDQSRTNRGPIEDQSRPAVAYLAIPWLFLRCLPTIPTPSNPPKATGGPPLVSGPYTWSFHGARIG